MNSALATATDDAMLSLRRHVPELAVDWLHEHPDRRWQILDGTLCFADVSGFTALAERLAMRGRIGGEELISRLGGIFSDMLGAARERGGSLLKFGGDALLLFFQGDDHPRQAAAAAVEMRRVLRASAQTPTSVGPLRLSMSVGLRSGPAHFFLVGSRHRELVLLGPAADELITAENMAAAGEILVSASTAALLPKGAIKLRPDGSPLLRWRTPAVPPCGRRLERPVTDTLLQSLFPPELGTFLAAGPPEPEHRLACIAFVRFSGTDALLAQHGPDAVADALEATLGPIQACLAEGGITLLAVDVDRDGGKLFLASGVPHARADDEGSMLRALRRIADQKLPLALQMGVNRGHVFAAEVGSPLRAAYSAMGDTTNTAARIAAKAPIGTLYAHPAVLDESLAVFAVEPSPPLTMKGKKAAVVVYSVGPAAGTRRREGLTLPEFLGRDAELARIAGAIAAAAAGRGSVVCVTGASGLGKSRLIEEALGAVPELPTLALRGEPNARGGYALLQEPLRRALGLEPADTQQPAAALLDRMRHVTPDLVPFAPLLGEVLGIELPASPESTAIDGRFRTERTADVLVRFLAAALPGPLVWVVDDAQWCDESSAAILMRLARACGGMRWLLLVARRPDRGGYDPCRAEPDVPELVTLDLAPLAPQHLSSLLRLATEAAPLRPHELEAIVRRAGGNPLFALEVLRVARDAGSFDAVPESLEAAMAAQVDALDPAARRLLRFASVLGGTFSRAVLAEAVRGEGLTLEQVALERLEDYLQPVEDDELRFRSQLVCETIYEGLSYRLRRRLHRQLAETLERLAPQPDIIADVLSLHFGRSEDHAAALKYATIAADRARERYANAEAIRFYELAVASARELSMVAPAARIELLTRLGEVRERAGLLEASLEAYRKALALAGSDPLIRADLLYRRATAKERMRALNGALRDLQAGLRLLNDPASAPAAALRARLQTAMAWVLFAQDRVARTLSQARTAAAEAEASGERGSLASSFMIMDLASLMAEGPGPGNRLKEALEIFESLGDLRMQASVQANLGFLCAVAGRWEEATGWLRAARAGFEAIGDIVRSADPALNLGEMLVKQRRYAEAEPILQDAIRTLRATHFGEGVNQGEMQLARILIERGDFPAAEAMLARVERESQAASQPVAAVEAISLRAVARLKSGDPEAALRIADAARESVRAEAMVLLPLLACHRSLILAALGRHDSALAEIETGLRAARDQGLHYELGVLLQAKADVTRQAGAAPDAADVEAAEQILGSLGVRPGSGW